MSVENFASLFTPVSRSDLYLYVKNRYSYKYKHTGPIVQKRLVALKYIINTLANEPDTALGKVNHNALQYILVDIWNQIRDDTSFLGDKRESYFYAWDKFWKL